MIRPQIYRGADLIRCKRTYIVDITSYRKLLYNKYKDMVADPAEGTYLQDIPVMTKDSPGKITEGRTIYRHDDVMRCNEPITLYTGTTIPASRLLKKRLGLASEQTTMYVFNRIIMDCVRVAIIDNNPHKQLLPDPDIGLLTNLDQPYAFLYDYFKDEYIPSLRDNDIDPLYLLDDLLVAVGKKTADREEYLWVVDVKGTDLYYGYVMDVRAFTYELSTSSNM